MGNPVIEVDNISMMFNLNKEKIDNLKEYVIKFLTRSCILQNFGRCVIFLSLSRRASGSAYWGLTARERARC